MFRLKSNALQREFKVNEGYLYASRIRNTRSGMDLVPDGNSTEFTFHFTDGTEFSSKGLKVTDSAERDGKLVFTFEEFEGITVTMRYWVGRDGNTLKKQLQFIQATEDKVIDYIALEHIGVINSQTHFSIPDDVETSMQIPDAMAILGQPFYIDSLFFGCEFPATDNRIQYGIGQVKYYVGHPVHGRFTCPATVMGGATGNTMAEVQGAFFDYIEYISTKSDFRVQYNSWYDHMLDIDADNIERSFYEIEQGLSDHGVPPLDAYVIDDGWNNYKAPFWSFNKKFPNKLTDATDQCHKLGSTFGLWLGPRGGYTAATPRFAKKIEKGGNGYLNSNSMDICVGSEKYLQNLEKFLTDTCTEFDIQYLKLDGFCLKPCTNPKHDHITGGENDMYFVTEMWQRWIDLFTRLRESRAKDNKPLWINMTCYVNPSPWWLQYVNSVWLQNSMDIGFAKNLEQQAQVDAEITYRDSMYYDFMCTRALQFPAKHIYNHEPIYGNTAKVEYTDEEFEKFLFWNACRGQAFNELYLSYNKMNSAKWRILARMLRWQKANHHILKNAMLLGGDPAENNIYAYAAWTKAGEGIIALRNPTDEKTDLTLTLNKLMGCPENLRAVKCYNVYNTTGADSLDLFSYGDKMQITLAPFEMKIFQFGDRDNRCLAPENTNDFTLSFTVSNNADANICRGKDVAIWIANGVLHGTFGGCKIQAPLVDGAHHITFVRYKNKMVKLFMDRQLVGSAYAPEAAPQIATDDLASSAANFSVADGSTPFEELMDLKAVLSGSRKFKRKRK